MLTKEVAKVVLDACLTTGGDFAEIFYEDNTKNSIQMISGKVDSVITRKIHGAGIRILLDKAEVYGYTNDCSENGLLVLAKKLRQTFNEDNKNIEFELKEVKYESKHKLNRLSKDIPNDEKLKYVKRASDAMINYGDKRILQTVAMLTDGTQCVTIANSKGLFVKDVRNVQRLSAQPIVQNEKGMTYGHENHGGNFTIDEFDTYDIEGMAREACKTALTMVDAPEMKAGTYDVVMHNGFGGVLFHEACGHSLEATSVARGISVFTGKKGQKIASSVVSALDDGTIPNGWGSLNVDDEGHPTQRNVLIQDGILNSYMIDYANSRRMNDGPTGNSRRESYRFSPTSRMTNTFIAPGKSTFDEIISSTKTGLFAKKMGGGSVNPVTGEFNFSVLEGYMIEDGKITTPVKGAALIGNGKDTLFKIDMVGNNLDYGHGMCGSASGSIPANVGQPTIRIKSMTVGGAN